MIRHRTTRHADGVRRFHLRRFLHRPAVAATRTCEYAGIGSLIEDDRFEYTYDDENRLVSVYPITPAANDLAVENFYDHLHRRIQKKVYKYVNDEWTPDATHTFVWDGMNIVLERIVHADNTTRTCEYYWGPDRSGTEQGAGGVEGLLAVSIDGTFYFPLYGDNANIVGYISEAGTFAARYVYDPYGNIVETYGPTPNLFAFGFSTKYHDREINLIAYQRRFYVPEHGRWLNRDPIEEDGGVSMYLLCDNDPMAKVDGVGLFSYSAIASNYPTKNAYPTDVNSPNSVWHLIGGKVLVNAKSGNFKNSCAVRLSHALNKSGEIIPFKSGVTSSGRNPPKWWYIFSVCPLNH